MKEIVNKYIVAYLDFLSDITDKNKSQKKKICKDLDKYYMYLSSDGDFYITKQENKNDKDYISWLNYDMRCKDFELFKKLTIEQLKNHIKSVIPADLFQEGEEHEQF